MDHEKVQDMIESQSPIFQPIPFDDLIDKYSPLIGLKGDSYKSTTKMVFYSVLSNQLKHNFFTVDTKKIDMRIPMMIMMDAGYGKKNYEFFIKNTIRNLGLKYIEPTSFHPEQFIGKVRISTDSEGEERYKQVYGILSTDFVLIDEGKKLLTSNRDTYDETLKYIRTALDPIGDNEIEKKQVDLSYENRLHYYPTCNIAILSQPIHDINEKLLTEGNFRRFFIGIPNIPLEERMEAMRNIVLFENIDNEQSVWDDWIGFNKLLLKRKVNFSTKNLALIDDYIEDLLLNKISEEAHKFTISLIFNIKFLILKMAAIRAIVETPGCDIEILKKHIESAIDDHKEIWNPVISWISQQLILTSDKPSGWKESLHGWIVEGLHIKGEISQTELSDRYCIQYKGTYSQNTLKSYIYRAMSDLKKWGYVSTIEKGKKNAKILILTDEGKEKVEENMDFR